MEIVLDNNISKFSDKDIDIEAISSKSYIHRLLIAAALADKPCLIGTNIFSEDMKATMNCLNAMGADIVSEERGFFVKSGVQNTKKAVLFCNESGSTARFLLPLATVYADEATLLGKGKLPQRPNELLCSQMRLNGVSIDSDYIPINTKGRLKAGIYSLPGNVSSQYFTGLLISLPLVSGESSIVIEGKLESAGYIDITLDVLSVFGIKIERTQEGFHIPGNQKYILDESKLVEVEGAHYPGVIAEGDWSNSAYVLGMGVLNGEVMVRGLNPQSVQPDSAAIKLFEDFGACVAICNGDTVRVSAQKLRGIKTDVSQIPDLVPALAVIASFAESDSYFMNVQRLRIKESDRVESIIKLLESYGAKCEVISEESRGADMESDFGRDSQVSETLHIFGANIPYSKDRVCEVSSFNDHRIVMAAVMAHRRLGGKMIINGAEAINKSYPDFFVSLVQSGLL